MNSKHTLAAMITTISGSIIAAYAPAIRAIAAGHPYVTGCAVAIMSAILGILPSATGSES